MQESFLLDTSAFRALPSTALQNKARTFYASPYCFWELLTHLDEEDFARKKGQLMKFKHTRFLDDPRADIELPLLPNDGLHKDRVPDDELIAAILGALKHSESLESFYSAIVKDTKGNVRQVQDCAATARRVLEDSEQTYSNFIQQIVSAFDSGQVLLETELDFHQGILQLLEGEVVKLRGRGITSVDLREKLINRFYIHYSYIFQRAYAIFKKKKAVDPNDFEDAQICLHLKLDTEFCLVTADKGLKEALEKTIALIDKLNEQAIRAKFQVTLLSAI